MFLLLKFRGLSIFPHANEGLSLVDFLQVIVQELSSQFELLTQMLLENADSTLVLFCKCKRCLNDWVALLRHSRFKFSRSENWLCEILKLQFMNLSKYSSSMGKEFAQQLVVHSGCWLMDSWLQRLGSCRYRATDPTWSFCVLDKARPTPPNCYLYFHHSCHWSDTPDSKIYQSKVDNMKGNRSFPGDVLARAAIERSAAASQSCADSMNLSDLLIYAA